MGLSQRLDPMEPSGSEQQNSFDLSSSDDSDRAMQDEFGEESSFQLAPQSKKRKETSTVASKPKNP